MFGIGMPELLIIMAVALIVIGPKKLPDMARALGKGMAEFKRAAQDIKESINIDADIKEVKDGLADSVSGVRPVTAPTEAGEKRSAPAAETPGDTAEAPPDEAGEQGDGGPGESSPKQEEPEKPADG